MSNDWLLRQFEDAARALASYVLGRDHSIHELPEETDAFSQGDMMLFELRAMVRDGRINEAENLLFETLENNPLPQYLPTALHFYEQLQMLSDARLAACNFPREEILEGVAYLRTLYEKAGAPPAE